MWKCVKLVLFVVQKPEKVKIKSLTNLPIKACEMTVTVKVPRMQIRTLV